MNLIDQDKLPKYNPLSSFTTKKTDTLCDRRSITICKTSSFLQSTLKVKESVSLKTLSPILDLIPHAGLNHSGYAIIQIVTDLVCQIVQMTFLFYSAIQVESRVKNRARRHVTALKIVLKFKNKSIYSFKCYNIR